MDLPLTDAKAPSINTPIGVVAGSDFTGYRAWRCGARDRLIPMRAQGIEHKGHVTMCLFVPLPLDPELDFMGMAMRTELAITYDRNMHPLSAKCKGCGEQMRPPAPELKEPVDIILWFSQLYVEHRKLKHAIETQSAAATVPES